MKKYRIEFNRNLGYKSEVAYITADSHKLAMIECKATFGKDITILEVCKVYAKSGNPEDDKEQEQLVDWIKELKAYREIGTVRDYEDAIRAYTEEYNLRKELQDEIMKHRENNQKILEYIHSGNRGRSDYFIVDQIEELLEGTLCQDQ